MKMRQLLAIMLFAVGLSSCRVYVPEYTTVEEMYKLEKGMSKEQVNTTLGIKPHEFYTSFDEAHTAVVYKYKKQFQKVKRDSVYETKNLAKGGTEYFKNIGNLYVLFDSDSDKMDYFITTSGRKSATNVIAQSRSIDEIENDPKAYLKGRKGKITPVEDATYLREGYTFSADLYIGSGMLGARVYNGYAFGVKQTASLGVGFESLSPFNNILGLNINVLDARDSLRTVSVKDYHGFYIPISLRYTYDIGEKMFRPFVFGELGYALNTEMTKTYTINNQTVDAKRLGGPLADVGFGFKINSKKRFAFSIAAGIRMRSYWVKEVFTEPVPDQPNSGWRINLTPTIGVGFNF